MQKAISLSVSRHIQHPCFVHTATKTCGIRSLAAATTASPSPSTSQHTPFLRHIFTAAATSPSSSTTKQYNPFMSPNQQPPQTNTPTSSSRAASSLSSAVSGSDILESFSEEEQKGFEGVDVAGAMAALANADAVCFDVDSTVITEEGIDVLAESLGKGKEVSAWTLKAMEGSTKFEDALSARLAIIEPSLQSIQKCLSDHPLQFSPGLQRLVRALQHAGTDVFLVSGGFRSMIAPVALELGIPDSHVVANTILHHEDGSYAGFDRDEPTSRDMGKPAAVRRVKEENGYETVVMVGDGATDAQAKPPADAFVGYGGVAVREKVRSVACWYVKDFEGMTKVVERFGKGS